MSNETDHREAVGAIRSYYSAKMLHAQAAGTQYAQMALRSVLTLNTGVAVAYPTINQLINPGGSVGIILLPTGLAILGAVFAILSAYSTYFNHNFEANYELSDMELSVLRADEFFDKVTYWRFHHHRSQSKDFWENEMAKANKWLQFTFVLGNVLGVLSLVAFVASVLVYAGHSI